MPERSKEFLDVWRRYASALQGPVHDKSFTRFVMPWRWDGQPAILQSRAYDDAGNAQPLRADDHHSLLMHPLPE